MDIHALPCLRYEKQLDKPLPPSMPLNPVTIGDHLRKNRIKLNLLQRDVAKVIGVTEDTITNWEKNRSIPKIKFMPHITKFLGYRPFEVDMVTLPGRLKAYRYINGVSQKQLGLILNVDGGTICSWELGENQPYKKMLIKLNILFKDKLEHY